MRPLLIAVFLSVMMLSHAAAQQASPAAPGTTQGQVQNLPQGSTTPPPRFLARDLAGQCEGAEGSPRQAACLRYLQGAVAMYDLIVVEGAEISWFCAPREAPATLLQEQYVDWIRENADQESLDAIQAVRLAMSDAFPCQE